MATPILGVLEKVDLRVAWTSEWNGFTPWLAQPENLRLLAETVGHRSGVRSSGEAGRPLSRRHSV